MRYNQEMEEWYAGKSQLKPSSERIKKYLVRKFTAKCWECDWINRNPFNNMWVIDLDHVDGDHANTDPKNFRLLCPNCHAMTPTYKNLNRKSEREGQGPFRHLREEF